MKRKFKQWWSTIPPISTKRTIASHLKQLKKKRGITTYGVKESRFSLGTGTNMWRG